MKKSFTKHNGDTAQFLMILFLSSHNQSETTVLLSE